MNKKSKITFPDQLKCQLPISTSANKNVLANQEQIKSILDRQDRRFLMIVGPCSFHDEHACIEYANKLKLLANKVADKIYIVIRVYLEKSRTALGWKGYLSDPYCDGTNNIQEGIKNARNLLLKLGELNIPVATEVLNPLYYKYFDDLICWVSIGARTVESQLHREIASGLTIPVGFKNSVSGNIKAALNGILFASNKHSFLHVNSEGYINIEHTKGNPYAHLVMRGGDSGPNYTKLHIDEAKKIMTNMNISKNIIIDCSHGNSSKNHLLQEKVLNDVIIQKLSGNQSIIGIMLESFLLDGSQSIASNLSELCYGRSITDSCIDWDDTVRIIEFAYDKL